MCVTQPCVSHLRCTTSANNHAHYFHLLLRLRFFFGRAGTKSLLHEWQTNTPHPLQMKTLTSVCTTSANVVGQWVKQQTLCFNLAPTCFKKGSFKLSRDGSFGTMVMSVQPFISVETSNVQQFVPQQPLLSLPERGRARFSCALASTNAATDDWKSSAPARKSMVIFLLEHHSSYFPAASLHSNKNSQRTERSV